MTEPKKEEIYLEDDADHIFRFEVEVQEELEGEPLTELIRTQLAALLDVIVLINGDTDVVVDGFRFINSNQKNSIWKEINDEDCVD